jgi:hypothetical protein
MIRLALAFVLAASLFAFDARAEDWAKTFDPDAVASQFDGKAAFIVVSAGEPDASLARAAAALEAALKAKDRADLVMNGKSLGNTAELDDPAIVKKAAALPVTRIAIVRVFGTKAVVTVYDPQANVVVAFSGDAGKPLSARAGGAIGVSTETTGALAVLRTEKGGLGPKAAAAKQEYLEKAIWFQDMVGMNQYGAVVSSWSNAVQGIYRKPLEGDAFYTAVGRPDLAEIYRERASTRAWYGGTGLLAGIVGTTVLTVGFVKAVSNSDPCGYDSDVTKCQNEHVDEVAAYESAKTTSRVLMLTGGILSIGAIVALCKSGMTEVNPVDAPEARRLAHVYNEKLQQDLGLSDEELESDEKPKKSSLEITGVSLLPTAGGAYAGLQLRF